MLRVRVSVEERKISIGNVHTDREVRKGTIIQRT